MLTPEQLAEAKQMIEAAAAGSNGNGTHTPGGWSAPAPVAANPWGAPAPAGMPGPEKVLVPIKVPTPNGGTVKILLQFPGEMAANPQTLMNALAQLSQTMPLDVWMPKQNWGGGGNGGGYRNGNGGGWGRGF